MPRAPKPPAERWRDGEDYPSASWQVAVLGDMLATLDTLTAAGQHHVMSKVLAVVREQVGRMAPMFSGPDRKILAGLVGDLEHESDRRSPDPSIFTPRAERLIKLLALVR
ncbi:MAG TPA: hypothetical protein VH853_05290 [Polyangia bacterium]|nr:hypothetical protein [Polyangia bacterium]